MIELAPSILTADFCQLGEQVHAALAAGIERIHFDVMDGQFVPNITFGPALIAALTPAVKKVGAVIEVHLMIEQPDRYLADYVQAGGELLLVHVEACTHLHRTLQSIHALGAKAGVALNPSTPLAAVDEILSDVDQILVMSVNPGFGGQHFIPASLDKLRRLRRMLDERGLAALPIEVDGGVNAENIALVQNAGASVTVTGSAVFNRQGSVTANVAALRAACSTTPSPSWRGSGRGNSADRPV